MYSQFERQFTDFLRSHLGHLDFADQNRASESAVISQMNEHLTDACRGTNGGVTNGHGGKVRKQENSSHLPGHQSHHDHFKPVLVKSLKSEELAQAHVCFAQELLRTGDYNLALTELCQAIKNCTTIQTFRQILVIRVTVLFRMKCLAQCQSDMFLLRTVCCGECRDKLFGKIDSRTLHQKYQVFLDKFGVCSSCTMDRMTRISISKIVRKFSTTTGKHCTTHNPPRDLTIPDITDPLSDEYPYVSRSVEIRTTPDKGRHVVARQPLQIGDIIAVEDARTWTLLPQKWDTHCQLCLNICHQAPFPCLDCPDVVYCSVECMMSDTAHKLECGYMPALRTLPKIVYLAFRTVIMFRDDIIRDSRGLDTSVGYKQVSNLITNLEHRVPVDIARRAALAIFLNNLVKELGVFKTCGDGGDMVTGIIQCDQLALCHQSIDHTALYTTTTSLLLKCLQSYPCNAHEISELQVTPEFRYSTLEDIGAGAFPFLSLINHSCNPNVVRHSLGHVTVLRVLRSIGTGQELCDNYGYHYATHTAAERSKALKSQYLFVCRCVPCVEGTRRWSVFSDIPGDVTFRCGVCRVRVSEEGKRCEKCGRNLKKFIRRIRELEASVRNITTLFVSGTRLSVDMAPVIEYLTLCESHTIPPFTMYNECQEVLKQKWNLESNQRIGVQ